MNEKYKSDIKLIDYFLIQTRYYIEQCPVSVNNSPLMWSRVWIRCYFYFLSKSDHTGPFSKYLC